MSPEMGFSTDPYFSGSIVSIPIPETLACSKAGALRNSLAGSTLQGWGPIAEDNGTFHVFTKADTGHGLHFLVTSIIGPFHSPQTCFSLYHMPHFSLYCTFPLETASACRKHDVPNVCWSGLPRLVFMARRECASLLLPCTHAEGFSCKGSWCCLNVAFCTDLFLLFLNDQPSVIYHCWFGYHVSLLASGRYFVFFPKTLSQVLGILVFSWFCMWIKKGYNFNSARDCFNAVVSTHTCSEGCIGNVPWYSQTHMLVDL